MAENKSIFELRYKELFHIISHGIVYHDKTGAILDANPAAEKILGLTLRQMQGLDSMDPRWKVIDANGNLYPGEKHPVSITLSTGKSVSNVIMGVFNPEENSIRWINVKAKSVKEDDEEELKGGLVTFEDITGSKEKMENLEENEQKLAAILNTIVDGVISIDDRGLIKAFNPAAAKIFNYIPEEVIGENIRILMPEPYKESHDRYISNYLSTGVARIIGIGREVIGIRKNGEKFPLYLSVGEVKLGEKRMFAGVVRDISHQKNTEINLKKSIETLSENEKRLRAILETAAEGIITISAQGIIQSFNPSACKIFGYLEQEVIGRNINILMPEPFKSAHDDYIQNYLLTGIARIVGTGREVIGRKKDGSTFPLYLSVGQLKIKDRIVFTGIIRDITQEKHFQSELQKSRETLELALKGAELGMWDWDIKNNKAIYDERWSGMLGYHSDAIESRIETWKDLIHPDDKDFVLKFLEEHLQGKTIMYETEHRLMTSRGTWKWVLGRGTVTERNQEGKPIRMTGTQLDIDGRKRAQEERDRIFRLSSDMMGVANFEGYFKRINPAFHKVLGYENSVILQKPFIEFVYKDDRQNTIDIITSLENDNAIKDFENRFICSDGSIKWISWAAISQKDDDSIYFVARDVTEKKKLEETLKQNSITDALTGLPNRRAFDERLKTELARARRHSSPLTILLIDVDHFKLYNDFYGHQAGDKCLKEIAKLLDSSVKRPGELPARYGGEEFSIILPMVNLNDAKKLSEMILNNLSLQKIPHEKSLTSNYVSLSIGIATYDPERDKKECDILERADKFLYRAKETGRNKYCF